MIRAVTGDILLSKADAIAHGIAPNDHMDSGLALALRKNWPAMANDFRHYCHQQNPKPGTAWIWGGPGGVRVVSLLTQEPLERHAKGHPGKAEIKHVNHALKELRKAAEKEGFKSIALPRLATGVGGLEWKDVKPLIEQHLGDLEIPIYVYESYAPGQAAQEA